MHPEPDMGFNLGSPGSCPGPKAGAKLPRHPGIPPWVSSVNPDKAGCEEGDQHHTTAAPPSPASRAHAGQDLWPSTCRPGSEPHVVDVTAEADFVVLMLGGGHCFMKLGVCFKSVGKKKNFFKSVGRSLFWK